MSDEPTKTKTNADVAHLYRALGRSGAVGMVMPFQVTFLAGSVVLRYRTVEDVDAAVAALGGRAVHDTYTHDTKYSRGGRRVWHAYGTRHGGGENGALAGWCVQVWAAVDGPAPETAVQS